MSRVTDQGLPRSVSVYASLPANAYNGAVCVVESGDGAGTYAYTGSSWTKLATAVSSSGSSISSVSVIATQSALPSSTTAGQIVFCSETSSLFFNNGGSWARVDKSPDYIVVNVYAAVSNLPESASPGQLAFVTATHGLYFYNGTAWKKLSEASS